MLITYIIDFTKVNYLFFIFNNYPKLFICFNFYQQFKILKIEIFVNILYF